MKRQLGAAQEKIARQQKRGAEKKHQAQAALEGARKEKAKAENEAASTLKSTIEQENLTTKALQQKMQDATREHEAVLADMKEKLEQLETQMQTYHYKLETAMSAAPAISIR